MNTQFDKAKVRRQVRQQPLSNNFEQFYPEAVTAKNISRLSRGVARLTANDFETTSPSELSVGKNLIVPTYSNAVVKTTCTHAKINKPKNNKSCSIVHKGSLENNTAWLEKIPSCPSKKILPSFNIASTECKHDSASLPIRSLTNSLSSALPAIISPFVLTTAQRMGPNPGSKRSFAYMMNESRTRPCSTSKLPNHIPARRKTSITLPQLPSRQSNLLPELLVPTFSYTCSPTCQYPCSDSSSDSSMLSITPPRSSPSASSSPVISSSSDSDTRHRRPPARKNRRRLTGVALSHETDCWRWRDPSGDTHRIGSTMHSRSHRLPISSNGDDSSDGPLCRQKKARISYPLTFEVTNSCKQELEHDEDNEAEENMRVGKEIEGKVRLHQYRCNCAPSTLSATDSNGVGDGLLLRRRTASLSPGQTRAGRRQKPTKLKISLLVATAVNINERIGCNHNEKDKPSSMNVDQLTNCNPPETRACHSDADAEGDDECSDPGSCDAN